MLKTENPKPITAREVGGTSWGITTAIVLALLLGCSQDAKPEPNPDQDFCQQIHRDEMAKLSEELEPFSDRLTQRTAVYVLEQGDEALVARAWLSEAAERSIDIQYFIFSADNVGLIAIDYLLRAAERGVKVRVLVDDFLVDADGEQLLTLDTHENLSIKIYNPNINIGK